MASACSARAKTHPGLFHAFGFNGHGFLLGPAVGAVLRELILDGKTQTDVSGLGIGRFRTARRESRLLSGAQHEQKHHQASSEEDGAQQPDDLAVSIDQHEQAAHHQKETQDHQDR